MTTPTRHRLLRAALGATLVLGPAALAEGPAGGEGEFGDWANRPRERFDRGEQAFQKAKAELLKGYVRSDLTEDELYRAAVEGMLRFADPKMKAYNALIGPAEYAELKTDMQGELVGIGVQIEFDAPSGLISVVSVLAGSPAAAADVREGDKILTIDGRSFKDAQTRDVVYAIRGKEGESVKLGILRDAQVITKTARRGKVKYELVQREALPEGIQLVKVHTFAEPTPAALKAALEEAGRAGARGLIVDLRDNPGGLLARSVESAKLLLPRGKVVVKVRKRGGVEEVITQEGEPAFKPVPTVVLINSDTKSSAELVAAALRDGLRAPLIGQKTVGKWSAQQLEELPNKYVMKYTVATFAGPDGKSYEGEGLPPDVEVVMDPKDLNKASRIKDPAARLAADVQLRAAHNLLRMHP